MQNRRRLGALATLTALALGTTGCFGGGSAKPSASSAPPSASPSSTPTPTGPQLDGHWPLTGLPGHGPIPTWPVVVVKMDNTESSRPQVGVGKADLVVEELVEGGLTRLAVFYYRNLPPKMGPVRSMRASDIGVVKPVRATIVTSGAAPLTYGRLRANQVRWIENFDKNLPLSRKEGFVRDDSRIKPYNLFIITKILLRNLTQPKVTPAAYLPWGSDQQFAAAKGLTRATSFAARFSPGHTSYWTYHGGRYVNTNSNAGSPFPADSVLVLRVKERDAGYLDPAGHHVPETVFTGSGPAVLFHGGRELTMQWHKSGPDQALTLTRGGRPVTVPAGHTWIELLPDAAAGGYLSVG